MKMIHYVNLNMNISPIYQVLNFKKKQLYKKQIYHKKGGNCPSSHTIAVEI